ncbi:hypothetical protein HW932_20160 [Allochromatium humboldtianum]|uniref:Uncharacterized protein n=1 Tax=Allochromatium humboldtianum TaxID=504901 RepID=A0A850RHA4_9GAMM|nr:hypothetical protein [Allochromatium humboldtianum]NVZ11566.1 hypothetical protein [Allochromatium humboldtianum]
MQDEGDEGPRFGPAGTEGKIEAVFPDQEFCYAVAFDIGVCGFYSPSEVESDLEVLGPAEDTIHVLVAERDGVDNRSIVFEQYVDRSSLEQVRAFQAGLGDRFGKTRIAKLVFVD